MFCTSCGKKVSKNSKFCEYCGKKISRDEIAAKKQSKILLSDQEILNMEEKNTANQTTKKGIIFIILGLVLTGITYIFAEPGGSYYIFWGLPVYGFYLLIKGLNQQSSLVIENSQEKIFKDDNSEKIIGWYKELGDRFFCTDCFNKTTIFDTKNYKAVRGIDLKQNVYTCDACKKEL